MVKCIICNENLNRSYVRITIDKKKTGKTVRKWKAIGYFCRNDKIFIADKDFPKYQKNLTKNKK